MFFDVLKGMEANVLQQNKVIASYLHRVAMPLKHTRLRLQGAEGVYAIPDRVDRRCKRSFRKKR